MRISAYLMTLMLGLGITGCTTKTDSDTYKMKSSTERAVTGLRTVTVMQEGSVEAIISGIYLNAVYPGRYRDGEYFLVSVYDAMGQNVLGTLRLNDSVDPSKTETLGAEEPLLRLMPIRNAWERYYLLKFPLQHGAEQLILTPGSGRSVQGALSFRKVVK